MIVVSDTSPITNLAAVGQLDLLRQLYGKVFIPESVRQELSAISSRRPIGLADQNPSWIEVRPVADQPLVDSLLLGLDPGEAEAIVLALEMKADI